MSSKASSLFFLLLIYSLPSLPLSDHASKSAFLLIPPQIVVPSRAQKVHSFTTIGYEESSPDQTELARYFLFNKKTALRIRGDGTSGTRDVRAEWFGLPATFAATLSLFPKYKRNSFFVSGAAPLRKIIDWELLKYSWVGIGLGAEFIGTSLRAKSADTTLLGALGSSSLKFARFAAGRRSEGISEIRLMVGSDYQFKGGGGAGMRSYLSLPGGEENSGEYLLEATRGYNGHIGFSSGCYITFPLVDKKNEVQIYGTVSGDAIGFVSNKQWRTFDLKNKPWSRYLRLNKNDGSSSDIPATTILTRQVRVDPHVIGSIIVGVDVLKGRARWNLSYRARGHGTEQITLLSGFSTEYGIAGSSSTTSASGSTITKRASNDSSFTVIEESDLDLSSGGAGSVLLHSILASVEYGNDKAKLHAKASYTAPHNNAYFTDWGVQLGFDLLL